MNKISINTNKELVEEIKKQLSQNDGYCPCALEHTSDTKCMCKDFRDKINDPEFSGECHCGLYIKSST